MVHHRKFPLFGKGHTKIVAHYTLHLITYAPAKFEVATFTGVGRDAFTRNALYDLGVKVTQYIVQYPLHHMAYVPAKFVVATSRFQEEMHLQENTLFDLNLFGNSISFCGYGQTDDGPTLVRN